EKCGNTPAGETPPPETRPPPPSERPRRLASREILPELGPAQVSQGFARGGRGRHQGGTRLARQEKRQVACVRALSPSETPPAARNSFGSHSSIVGTHRLRPIQES